MLVTQLCPSLCNPLDCMQLARILCPWNSPGKNTGVGSRSLLQGIFPTQGLNLGLLHCRPILYHLSHQGNPLPRLVGNAKLPVAHTLSWTGPVPAINSSLLNDPVVVV